MESQGVVGRIVKTVSAFEEESLKYMSNPASQSLTMISEDIVAWILSRWRDMQTILHQRPATLTNTPQI